MKRITATVCIVSVLALLSCCGGSSVVKSDYPITPVSFRNVDITDGFWAPRIETTRTVTLPYLIDLAQQAGRQVDGRLAEAASDFLAKIPDPELQSLVEAGFDPTIERFRRLKGVWSTSGDGTMGGAGYLAQSGIAFYETTGNRKLLDAAIEIADDLDALFGPGKRYDISNHEGVKMGLIPLYRVTGDERYVALAKFLLDRRGNPEGGRTLYGEYAQDHVPIKSQTRAIGHAVRATYLYNSLTDIAALTGDPGYAQAADRIWEDAVTKRTYLTGGVGSYRDHEDYGDDYDLPNLACWNEICAAVGNAWWSHRMFLLNRDAKYLDVAERVMYNGLLAGVSLNGDHFLYQTPLKAYGDFARQPRFGPNCCPPNITRFLASMGKLIYATDRDGIYVNLFIGSKARIPWREGSITLEQATNYPWDGGIRITVEPDREQDFGLSVRIPGWARGEAMPGGLYRFMDPSDPGFKLAVNGEAATFTLDKGFARIERTWAKGDMVELELPMTVRKVLADDRVADDRGMVALQRGPLVFCAESIDNGGEVFNLLVPDDADFDFSLRQDVLGGMGMISGPIIALSRGKDQVSVERREQDFHAIPYYAFGNRGSGEMAVWLARDASHVELPPVPTIASTSRPTSSCGDGTFAENYPDHKLPTIARRFYPSAQDGSGDIRAIFDQIVPVNSEDGSSYYLRLRPQAGDQAWVQYDFPKATSVSSVDVYWKDDKQYCPAPSAWRLVYKDGDAWKPVETSDAYGVEKDKFNTIRFEPVTTRALRLEIQLQPKTYTQGLLGPPDANWMREDTTWYEGGLIEWRIHN
jgi:DUF1680 family protein